MTSIKYITDGTLVISGLMAVGITTRIIYTILTEMTAGEALPDILNKIKKKLKAAILAICLSAFLGVIKRYYL